MNSSLSEKVSMYRKRMGYSQEKFGALFDVKCSTYANWEKKGKFPDEILKKMLKVFDITVDELFDGVTDERPLFTYVTQQQNKPSVLEDSRQGFSPKQNEEFMLTATEKSLIKVFRNLSKEQRNDVLAVVNSYHHKK